jgi:hypothetical protein
VITRSLISLKYRSKWSTSSSRPEGITQRVNVVVREDPVETLGSVEGFVKTALEFSRV